MSNILLSFTEIMYNIKWNLIVSMGKYNACSILRHILNKIVCSLLERMSYVFHRFFFASVLASELSKDNLK